MGIMSMKTEYSNFPFIGVDKKLGKRVLTRFYNVLDKKFGCNI